MLQPGMHMWGDAPLQLPLESRGEGILAELRGVAKFVLWRDAETERAAGRYDDWACTLGLRGDCELGCSGVGRAGLERHRELLDDLTCVC